MGRRKGSKNKEIIQKEDKKINDGFKHNNDIAHQKLVNSEEKPTKEQTEKQTKLHSVLQDLSKEFGKDSIKFANTIESRERLPFKHKCLTNQTGGGVPRGTYTTIWGGKGVGKSTEVLDLIAETQKKDLQCVYINGERSYDPVYAKKRGIDTNKLIVVDVETLEQGLDTIIKLCRNKVADLIILDSIHGLAPKGELYEGKAEKEKSVDQDTMALRARKLTQFFEMATAFVAESKCAVVLLAQSRMDLGAFIKLETLTGGHALMHFSRLILRFRRGQGNDAPTEKRLTGEKDKLGKEKTIDVRIGFDMVIRVDKSQIEGCTEGNEWHVPFYFAEGIKE